MFILSPRNAINAVVLITLPVNGVERRQITSKVRKQGISDVYLPKGRSLCYAFLAETVETGGSFENEALENEDRSTKHPNLENEAPKSRNHCTLKDYNF